MLCVWRLQSACANIGAPKRFSHPFAFTFTEVDEIPHAPSGKYEDSRSELT